MDLRLLPQGTVHAEGALLWSPRIDSFSLGAVAAPEAFCRGAAGRPVATIGTHQLDKAVFEFFDAVRSYDAARAAKVLADDADFESPWSGGRLTGRAAVEVHLKQWLGDPKTRPSLTIRDIAGDGAVTRLQVSVSGRFGQAPRLVRMDVLCLKHVVHQVQMRDVATGPAH